jgi:hypothetical protein
MNARGGDADPYFNLMCQQLDDALRRGPEVGQTADAFNHRPGVPTYAFPR